MATTSNYIEKISYFAYLSTSLRALDILNYATLGIFQVQVAQSIAFYVFYGIAFLIAILIAIIVYQASGKTTKDYIKKFDGLYEKLTEDQKKQLNTTNGFNYKFYGLVFFEIISIIAAGATIVKETISKDNFSIISKYKNYFLYSIAALLFFALAGRIWENWQLQYRTKITQMIEIYKIRNDNHNPYIKTHEDSFWLKSSSLKFIKTGLAMVITFIAFLWLYLKILPSMPIYFHILVAAALLVASFLLLNYIVDKVVDIINKGDEKYVTQYITLKKIEEKKNRATSEKIYNVVIYPIFNFIIMALSIFSTTLYISGFFNLPLFYQSNLALAIDLTLTIVGSIFYTSIKQESLYLDEKMLILHAIIIGDTSDRSTSYASSDEDRKSLLEND